MPAPQGKSCRAERTGCWSREWRMQGGRRTCSGRGAPFCLHVRKVCVSSAEIPIRRVVFVFCVPAVGVVGVPRLRPRIEVEQQQEHVGQLDYGTQSSPRARSGSDRGSFEGTRTDRRFCGCRRPVSPLSPLLSNIFLKGLAMAGASMVTSTTSLVPEERPVAVTKSRWKDRETITRSRRPNCASSFRGKQSCFRA